MYFPYDQFPFGGRVLRVTYSNTTSPQAQEIEQARAQDIVPDAAHWGHRDSGDEAPERTREKPPKKPPMDMPLDEWEARPGWLKRGIDAGLYVEDAP